MLPCAVAFRCASFTERFNKEPSRNGLGAFMRDDLSRRVTAEFFGTFWLTFAGCGAAVLAAAFPTLGIGFVGVAFAFGLTVLTMAYAVGHISGGHFNPAVTLGLWSAGRCASKHVIPYIIAQVAAGIAAAAVLWLIASGKPDWVPGGFASNGYGDLSPGKYGLVSCALTEVLMTFFFLYIIIGTTSKGAAVGFAGIPIGLALTLIHLVSIPVTNTSVNPARSTGPALFAGGEYIAQLWLFWIGPIVGAVLAGLLSRWMYEPDVLVETIVVEEREGRRTGLGLDPWSNRLIDAMVRAGGPWRRRIDGHAAAKNRQTKYRPVSRQSWRHRPGACPAPAISRTAGAASAAVI